MLLRINTTENAYFEEFLRGLHDRKLRYYASDIQETLGMLTVRQLKDSIGRAMDVLRAQQLPVDEHFKPIYRCEEKSVILDWKLSELGYCLVLLNGHPSHPAVARMQLDLIKKGLR